MSITDCRFGAVGLSNARFTRLFQAVSCEFASDTRFIDTAFDEGADFSGSTFSQKPFFRIARAGRAVSFYYCRFSRGADFSSTRFDGDLSLSDIALETGILIFNRAEIGGTVRLMVTLQRDPQILNAASIFRWPGSGAS